MICHIGSQKVSLLAIGQTAQPPVVVVFEQHLDDVAAAQAEFIQSSGCVVVESDHLDGEHGGGGGYLCEWELENA